MHAEKKSLVILLLIEGTLILLFSTSIYWNLMPEDRHILLWSFFVGAILLLSAIFVLMNQAVYGWLHTWLQKAGSWLEVSPLQALLFTTSLMFTVLTIDAAGFWIRMRSPFAAVGTWVLGIGLASFGAWNRAQKSPPLSKGMLLWFTAVTLFAFLLRGIGTGNIPVLLTGDEASAGISAINYAKGDWNNLFISSWFSFPSLFSAIQSIGVGILGNTVEALRIPSAVVGALTVGIVYLWGRAMFGQRAGLFSALILASLHFHIHFSRLGLNNIWDGLWFTLTLGSLWDGWKMNARWAYILAGVGLGFSQYFYASGKALPILLLIVAALTFYFRRAQFLKMLPNLVVTAMVALAVFVPLAWHYLNEPKALLAPFARVSIMEETVSSSASLFNFLFQRLPSSLGAYTVTASRNWYLPGTPILRPISATFFYLGLIFLIFKDRDSRLALLTLWLVTFAFINALSSYTPAAQRYVASAPACAVIVGYGLDKSTQILINLRPQFKRLLTVASYLILGIIVISDLFFYFVEYTTTSRVDEVTSNGMVGYQFGNYLKDQPADTQFVVFGTPRLSFDSPAVLYLAPQIHGINAPQDWDTFEGSQLTSHRVIFVFVPEYRDKIDGVRETYPGGTLIEQRTWSGATLFWVYELALK